MGCAASKNLPEQVVPTTLPAQDVAKPLKATTQQGRVI